MEWGAVSAFGVRRIVKEVRKIKEVVNREATTGTVLQVKEARDFTAKLNGVASVNLGSHILEGVSPLVQNAADVRPKRINVSAAGCPDTILGKSDRSLWVEAHFVPHPPAAMSPASFTQLTR